MKDIKITVSERRVLIDTYDIYEGTTKLRNKLSEISGIRWKFNVVFMDNCCLICSEEDSEKVKDKTFTITVETFSDANKW